MYSQSNRLQLNRNANTSPESDLLEIFKGSAKFAEPTDQYELTMSRVNIIYCVMVECMIYSV